MGVFDTPGEESALAAAPAPADVSEPTTVPTEEELAQAEAEAKAAEEAAAKKKADAERIAKMNAAKAAKKAAEESAAKTAPAPAAAKEDGEAAPAAVAKVKLTPAELAELHEETGVKPSNDDIKTEKDMRDYLMAKPKVSVVIPLNPGEKPGSTEVVSVNGVALTIRKGVMVSIPKPFADQVMNFTNIQMENGTIGGDFAIEAGSAKAKALAS